MERTEFRQDKNTGCLLGAAIGDAFGAPTEFIRGAAEIEAIFGAGGPAVPLGYAGHKGQSSPNPIRVTDDTQMMLAVGEALIAAQQPYTRATVESPLRDAFVAWMNSPENTRAPGMTCMSACRRLQKPMLWQQATMISSKGCGANMRVQPVGLLEVPADTRAGLAQFQAALTHGHPTALAASDLTAYTIAALRTGTAPQEMPALLTEYAVSQQTIYHTDWLGELWQQAGVSSPQAFIAHGWNECLVVLRQLTAAVNKGDRQTDPCFLTGEGWIAEEAFATGMLCFLLYPEEPVAALRRAAVTCGDSDSIACLAGAYRGRDAWPIDWIERIEYRDRLIAVARGLRDT